MGHDGHPAIGFRSESQRWNGNSGRVYTIGIGSLDSDGYINGTGIALKGNSYGNSNADYWLFATATAPVQGAFDIMARFMPGYAIVF